MGILLVSVILGALLAREEHSGGAVWQEDKAYLG